MFCRVVLVIVDAKHDRDVRAFAGAVMITFFAPCRQVLGRASRLVKIRSIRDDVDAEVFQGSCAGSLTDSTLNSSAATVIRRRSRGHRVRLPSTESYLRSEPAWRRWSGR